MSSLHEERRTPAERALRVGDLGDGSPHIHVDLRRWAPRPLPEVLRAAGYEVRFDTPDHRGNPTLRVYESYVGLYGQQRLGLVDPDGRVWHYDAEVVAWVAEAPEWPLHVQTRRFG